tara:strand:+ start:22 stop:762 length:741 start_codon:yes stop_codon:yes gene_type:complete
MTRYYLNFYLCALAKMALIKYKIEYLAGDYITLDATIDSSNSASLLSLLSGNYSIQVLRKDGININNQDLDYFGTRAWISTGTFSGNPEFLNLHGAHIITQSIPKNVTKRNNRLAEQSMFQGYLDGDEIAVWHRGSVGPKTYNYKYNFYVSKNTDPALTIYNHRQRSDTFLTNACNIIKRRGMVAVYESVYSNTYVAPMTNPIKVGLFSELGEGGNMLIEQASLNSFISALDANNIEKVTEIPLFS